MVNVTAVGVVTTLSLDAAGDIFALAGSVIAEFSPTGALEPSLAPAALFAQTGAHGNGISLFGLARLTPEGSPDANFGGEGVRTTTFRNQTSLQVTAVLVQSDGKLVAVGQTLNPAGIANLAMARYLGQ